MFTGLGFRFLDLGVQGLGLEALKLAALVLGLCWLESFGVVF